MNKILTFNVAEATELGTHCALHHSYSPQEQKYIFRLDVYNQKQIKMAISQNAHHGQLDLNGFEHLENMLRFEVPTELWKQPNHITTTWRLPLST